MSSKVARIFIIYVLIFTFAFKLCIICVLTRFGGAIWWMHAVRGKGQAWS